MGSCCRINLMPKNIVILYSDTGGGHRSQGGAIQEALAARCGAEAQVTMVDGLKQYAPYPLNRLPQWYPSLSDHRRLWKYGYRLTDRPRRFLFITTLISPVVRRATLQLIRDHRADAYVAVHPLYLTPLLSALRPPRPPVITVVTDPVSVHAIWYHPKVDLYIVATEAARERLILNGVAPDKVRLAGLPVASRFCVPASDKARLRSSLGWRIGCPVVLVVGGGEGMGPVSEIAQTISSAGLDCELAVVAGRNQALRASLEAAPWKVPTHIYGFVTEMPDLMCAADVLVTKAGPATLWEAFGAGLPIVLYDYLPGQEEGNVTYVENSGAGRVALGPQAVVDVLREWLGPQADPRALAQAALNAQKLARPDAAARIAELIWHTV
jgi:1,2-diacylglycerol 3-beta-galactosyltransferase